MSQEFRQRVLTITAAIPRGKVASYGLVATLAGSPRAARAVGSILRSLDGDHAHIPWQRVLNQRGEISLGGDPDRAWLQRERLQIEGVVFDDNDRIDSLHWWDPGDAPNFLDQAVAPWEIPEDWDDD